MTFAEQIVIEVPDPTAMTAGAWVLVGTLVWYFTAGLVIRLMDRGGIGTNPGTVFAVWLFSPAVVAAFIVWVALCVLSCGAVITPWRWLVGANQPQPQPKSQPQPPSRP